MGIEILYNLIARLVNKRRTQTRDVIHNHMANRHAIYTLHFHLRPPAHTNDLSVGL